ncbi:MAG TPA: hypothetical protein VFN38_05095 [Gemmatimonadaceae bacterium]|nr:hypothetical protein [Gemmatimonadaceae bacterium]
MRPTAIRCMGWLVASAVLLLAGVGGCAKDSRAATAAAAAPWKDRVFTLFANLPRDASLDPWEGSLAVAPDHTVYWEGYDLFALRPGELQPRRPLPSTLPVDDVGSYGVAADGALIVSTYDRLWRLVPDGMPSWIAGTGEQGLQGDGGPATAAQLCAPSSIVARPDGGIVFAEAGGAMVRAIDPQGSISTLLTAEPRTTPVECGEEPRAEWIKPLAARANGHIVARVERPPAEPDPEGFLPADVVKFDRDGRRRTVAKDFFARAVADDDTMLAIDGVGLRRRAPGTKGHLLMKGDPSWYFGAFFDHDGVPAQRYGFSLMVDAIFAPDGGIIASLWADDREGARLLYLPPAKPGRTALALFPNRGRASARAYRARLLLTTPATATVTVSRGSRRLATRTASLTRGWHTLVARGHLPAAAATARVDVTGPGGQRAADSLRVVTGGRLPSRLARSALRRYLCQPAICTERTRLDACRRYGKSRVDCRVKTPEWCSAATARLTRSGIIHGRIYARCPSGGASPLSAQPRYERSERWEPIGPAQQH